MRLNVWDPFGDWNPFREMEALRRQVEHVFEDFEHANLWPFATAAFLPGRSARAYPLLNVREDENSVYVEALAPGIAPGSIEVSVVQNTVRIAGEKQPLSQDIKPEAYHRSERSAGKFVRTLTLPTEVDADKVTADYRNGVIHIALPKAEAVKPKKITVTVS